MDRDKELKGPAKERENRPQCATSLCSAERVESISRTAYFCEGTIKGREFARGNEEHPVGEKKWGHLADARVLTACYKERYGPAVSKGWS